VAILFHVRSGSSPSATATPAASGAAVTVRNDTAQTVQVQDCTRTLSACASTNAGTTHLAPGASGTERGATGLRLLTLQGHVLGCISLAGASNGSTVMVSSVKACP
jgi:hypothetical protein